MNAVRIHTRLESETLTLPQLRPLVGKQVEIIVREDVCAEVKASTTRVSAAGRYPLRGSVLRYDEPFEPAAPAEEWEANR